MKKFFKELFTNSPIFVLLLGLCSSLAVTTNFESAYMMGICLTIILICSNTIVSIIKKLVPENVKIPVYIIIIATFVTITEILLKEYMPNLYTTLGVYLPLIVVNCIMLGRALSVASKNSVGKSFIDAIKTGLSYTLALIIIAFIRETLGNNSLTLMNNISSITGYKEVITNIFGSKALIPILTTPAGAFFTLAFLIAIINKIKGGKDESN